MLKLRISQVFDGVQTGFGAVADGFGDLEHAADAIAACIEPRDRRCAIVVDDDAHAIRFGADFFGEIGAPCNADG